MRAVSTILPLTIDALQFCARGETLLHPTSFVVPQGGITMLMGPNGAGKSLLLRLCHGLLQPDSGAIHWAMAGGVIAGQKRHAMVFQKPVMLRRSVEGNLAHALEAAGFSRSERRERLEKTLTRFGFADIRSRPARRLSGGEQQRLAIARAWSLSPDILFLDEPCSQLDPGATRQIETLLTSLAAEGVTLVMATHDIAQARRIADRVLFFYQGRLIEDQVAPAFFTSPETPEARAFLAGDLVW